MSDKRRTFAVIDGNSLMHRAFHAVPPTMNAPDGRPTNAIFGFLNMFLKMIDAFNPDGVVVAFDKGKPRVRMEMLPQYKAQRPPMDPDLHAQFPMIKELLTALNVPILQSEGWEGDDILGTMARLGEQAGCDMLLCEGMTSLNEARAALLAARETRLPVIVTLRVDDQGETATGARLLPTVITLQALGAAAVGIETDAPAGEAAEWIEEALDYAAVPLAVLSSAAPEETPPPAEPTVLKAES